MATKKNNEPKPEPEPEPQPENNEPKPENAAPKLGGQKKSPSVARNPDATPEEVVKAAEKVQRGLSKPVGPIIIPAQRTDRLYMPVVGDSCFISNRMDQKAVMMILAAHLQLPPEPRKAKDPYGLFRSCVHYLPDGSMGIPGGAFKAAMVGACRQLGKQIHMIAIKQFFHVRPDVVRIYGDTPRMCQHVVKNETGVIDIRFRAMFFRWSAIIPIDYDVDLISQATLCVLANRAGFGVGVGDWRPGAPESFNGRCGRFHVAGENDLIGEAHTKWCAAHPCNEIELMMAGIVPQDLVDVYRKAAELPPPVESAPPKKSNKKTAPSSPDEGREILEQLKQLSEHNPFERPDDGPMPAAVPA